MDPIKKVASILDMGGEGLIKRLVVGVDLGRDVFSRETIGGDKWGSRGCQVCVS